MTYDVDYGDTVGISILKTVVDKEGTDETFSTFTFFNCYWVKWDLICV
ncbi:hypothetical protein GCM10007290_23660 [Providencia stuartii]|nr:hypothetical protein GCM10007290_23660 [Providencia thailandensis]